MLRRVAYGISKAHQGIHPRPKFVELGWRYLTMREVCQFGI